VVSTNSDEIATFNDCSLTIIQRPEHNPSAQICKTAVVSSTPDATNQGLHWLHQVSMRARNHEMSELAGFVESYCR